MENRTHAINKKYENYSNSDFCSKLKTGEISSNKLDFSRIVGFENITGKVIVNIS